MGTVKGQINVIILRFILYIKVNKLLKLRNPKRTSHDQAYSQSEYVCFQAIFSRILD